MHSSTVTQSCSGSQQYGFKHPLHPKSQHTSLSPLDHIWEDTHANPNKRKKSLEAQLLSASEQRWELH